MDKGGNSQRSNGSRFTKPYNASNSFVTKVASKVSDYLGGWFGTPLKSSNNVEAGGTTSVTASGDPPSRHIFDNVEVKTPLVLSHRRFDDDIETMSPHAKRFKISSEKEKLDMDFPISPIPSTSGLFQSTINHSFDIPKSEEFVSSGPGPSSLQGQRYSRSNNVAPTPPSTTTEVKANGATDNHSDSSESTSGCSSLVPQSDRLSQSAYVCSSRKRNLEEKLKYARQLQQSRASMYLNRSIPVSDASGGRKKPSFDVTAYGSPSLDKSLLREKLINSPFYTGQTSYGGASAYRYSRNTFYSQRNPRNSADRREGMQVQVKPSHHGSTEDLTNMSHTAKKILEALEQFSTPVNDAKRIPTSRLNVPLGSKRRRFDDLSETKMKLSTPISPLNPNPGPVITGLNVPTVPDLLKLKRLERIQNSTAAARQATVQKHEYSLPSDVAPAKHTGKMVTKLKDKDKEVPMQKLEEVNLPKIPLPITTLPKFDFQLPPMPKPTVNKTEETEKSRSFKFSAPIPVPVAKMPERSAQKNSFTFSDPLNADAKREPEKVISQPSSLTSFMSSDAVAKLKRKPINSCSFNSSPTKVPPVPIELKTGSVMDFFSKSIGAKSAEKESPVKSASGTWECGSCLIRNLNDSKICCGCKASRVTEEKARTPSNPPKVEVPSKEESKPLPLSSFGDKFKPAAGSWSCKECFVNNNASATKCIACENPKPSSAVPKKVSTPEAPKPVAEIKSGFGDMFKKQANQWECSVCMIRNKETDEKCAACETPKPGSKQQQPEKVESKFSFGSTPAAGGFLFGIDKAGVDVPGVKSAADSSTFKFQTNVSQPETTGKPSQFNAISTSVGVFTFGIPPKAPAQDKKEESEKKAAEDNSSKEGNVKTIPETTNSRFMVTSTSGSNVQKEEQSRDQSTTEKKELAKDKSAETQKSEKSEVSISDVSKPGTDAVQPFFFGAPNKSQTKLVFGGAPDENKGKVEAKDSVPKFFFGSSSNSLEAVSSSTSDFKFGQSKTMTSQSTVDSGLGKPAPSTFQFKPFGTTEPALPKPNTNAAVDASKTESKGSAVSTAAPAFGSTIFNDTKGSAVSTSAAITTAAPAFGSNSIFNDTAPKVAFGITSSSSSSSGLGFGSGTVASTNPSPFAPPSQSSFTSHGFGAQPSATAPPPNSFGIMTASTDKPAMSNTNAFGSATGTFSSVPNPFASTVTTTPNPTAPKAFEGFGSRPSVPSFGGSSLPGPGFGGGFIQPSNATEKPAAATPFIFGSASSAPATTSAPAPAASAPGIFTFGASKPDTKPQSQFSFGQSSAGQGFGFGGNAPPSTNLFGSFGGEQPKMENSLGATGSPFGNATPTVFGQSSAPAAFESTAPKFEFGVQAAKPQESTTPSLFQFGAAPAQTQPASAPAATNFSLLVPQRFNFTGGQTPVFSAESPSTIRPNRKVIKAVRRTNRDNTRRAN